MVLRFQTAVPENKYLDFSEMKEPPENGGSDEEGEAFPLSPTRKSSDLADHQNNLALNLHF